VLIIGSSGQIGATLRSAFETHGAEVAATYRAHPVPGGVPLDVTDAVAVARCIATSRPELICFAANAPGGVDRCQTHPEEGRAMNAGALETLAAAAPGVPLVYFSSDYVFDGTAGPYAEGDPTGPINAYGRAKLEAECFLLARVPSALVVRTTTVYGWNPASKNVAMQIWERLGRGEPMQAPSDQWCNPTPAEYAADATARLALRRVRGLVHIAGQDWMPRADFMRALAEAFGFEPGLIVPVTTEALGQPAPRPLRAGLRTDRVAELLGEPPPRLATAFEALRRVRAAAAVR